MDTTPTAASAVTEGLLALMTAKYPGTCAAGSKCGRLGAERIRAGKDRIGYSRAAKLAFCWRCAENPERLGIVRAAIAARTGAAVQPPKTRVPIPCGQCQSCLAGCPCDEME